MQSVSLQFVSAIYYLIYQNQTEIFATEFNFHEIQDSLDRLDIWCGLFILDIDGI